jgi:tetratricopeptide (TPR) repeat protein
MRMIASGDKVTWDESLTNLSEAIRRDAQNATALLWRGASYSTLGFLGRAAEDYQRCVEIDSAYEFCRRLLALTYLCLGRTDDALHLYEMGLARGYLVGNGAFALTAAARGDRLGALVMLALDFRDYQPQLIQPLFRALTDPGFSEPDRQEALSLVDRANANQDSVLVALWILKAYDEMVAVDAHGPATPTVLWARDDAAWLKSSGRKKLMQRWRLSDYWRKHGFPPQCKAMGDADFECR